jgi:hypothetical protein
MAALACFTFAACDEGGTIDIPGPDIQYAFDFDSSFVLPSQLQQVNLNEWITVAGDTMSGNDLNSFLNDSANQKYSDMVQAATLKNAKFFINGGSFNGLDSIKLSYNLVGSSEVFDLVVGSPDIQSMDTIRFNDVRVTKAQVFELIGNDAIVTLKAKFNSANQNFLVPGAVYNFQAKTSLSVKLLGAAENMLGVSK